MKKKDSHKTDYLSLVILTLVSIIPIFLFLTYSEPIITTVVTQTKQTAAVSDFDSSLLAHYSFDGASGNTQGKVGSGAMEFDGDDYITLPNPSSFSASAYTLAWWGYATGANKAAIAYGTSTGSIGAVAGYYNSGWRCWQQGKNLSTSIAALNTWVFITCTYDGSTFSIYENGVLKSSTTLPPLSDTITKAYIGQSVSNGLRMLGKLDDVRIYNRALTASEINDLYDFFEEDDSPKFTSYPGDPDSSPTPSNSVPENSPPVNPGNGPVKLQNSSGTILNTFTTIQACASVVAAGQTCLVSAGNYPERVTSITNSGTNSNPITFKASGSVVMKGFEITNKSNVIIDGFEITGTNFDHNGISLNNSDGSKAINNYIHHTTGSNNVRGNGIILNASDNTEITGNQIRYVSGIGIRLNSSTANLSNDVLIKNNTIAWTGYKNVDGADKTWGQGIQPSGSNVLVENNDISHVADFITFGNVNRLVIRNNHLHSVFNSDADWGPHVDGVQGWGNNILVEGNTMEDVHEHTGGHAHFALFAAQSGYGSNNENATIRYNTVNGIDSGFVLVQFGYKEGNVYNNTVSKANLTAKGLVTAFTNAATGGKIFNNIHYDAVGTTYHNAYHITPDSFPGLKINNNLSWKASCGISCGLWNTSTVYPVPIGTDANGIYNQDPMFQNYSNDSNYSNDNFNLSANSPARNAGTHLTTVSSSDSGSGKILRVEDAGFFQDGWAGVEKDWIAVGSVTNISQISSIDYSSNVITLADAINRSGGDPVYLYKDSSGRRVLYGSAPDIGAYEYISDIDPSPTPSTLPTPTPDITPPTINIVTPTSGALSGTVPVTAVASDNIGVVGVEFRIDGTLITDDLVVPYTTSLNTTLLQNGTHTLVAIARDGVGNITFASVTITVDNVVAVDTFPPSIPTNLKAEVDTKSPRIKLTWNQSTDNVAVAGYEIWRDGLKIDSTVSNAYSDRNIKSNTTYTYYVRAYDAKGNYSLQTTSITISTPIYPEVSPTPLPLSIPVIPPPSITLVPNPTVPNTNPIPRTPSTLKFTKPSKTPISNDIAIPGEVAPPEYVPFEPSEYLNEIISSTKNFFREIIQRIVKGTKVIVESIL